MPHDFGHAVVNLDSTVAITENFMTVSALDKVAIWRGEEEADGGEETEGTRAFKNLVRQSPGECHPVSHSHSSSQINSKYLNREQRLFAREMLKQAKEAIKG